MTKEPNRCQNCGERDCEELFEVLIDGKVKEICEDCQRGKIIEEEEKETLYENFKTKTS